MRNRKNWKFRYRSNSRRHLPRAKEDGRPNLASDSFSNGKARNNFNIRQSADKLAERYNVLAKEAMASGDKILSENYFQHADHFMRIIDGKNLNQNQNKVPASVEPGISDRPSVENGTIHKDKGIEEKKE